MNFGKTLFAQLMDFLPWKTFHRIVARHDGDRIPALMTTGNAGAEHKDTARDIGIRELILKPITIDELGRALDRIYRGAVPNASPSA